MSQPPSDILAKTSENKLVITWSPDHIADYGFKYLRCHCGCANCVDENTGARTLDPDRIAQDIQVKDMSLVGSYAVQFVWSDDHDTGIYSWDHLLKICPCAKCGGPKSIERRVSALGKH